MSGRFITNLILLLVAGGVVGSEALSPAVTAWLSFAEAIGLVVLAVAGLAMRELRIERAVHEFAPASAGARNSRRGQDVPSAA